MTTTPTNNTPTEAQVTASQQPSGVPKGDLGTPKTEAAANGDAPAQMTKAVRENKRVTIPVDFDFETDPDPRPPMDPMNPPAAKQQQNPTGPSPVDQLAQNGIEIEFRGQKETVSLDAARTMLQQYKNMSSMSPVVGLANTIAEQLNIKDPREVAALIQTALMTHMKAQAGGDQAQPPAPDAEQMRQQTNGAPFSPAPPQITPDVQQAVKAFFDGNGLTPTPEMESAMTTMLAYGKHIQDMAAAFPQLAADVKMFKDATATNAQRALQDAVGARAAKVAGELGIDTQEELAGFQAWVQKTNNTFPGFTQRIRGNPDAMDEAIRTYHAVTEGTRAITAKKALETQVGKDFARAGGDAAPNGRVGTGAPPPAADDQKSFERDMMARM
jgi:hypothetical protein